MQEGETYADIEKDVYVRAILDTYLPTTRGMAHDHEEYHGVLLFRILFDELLVSVRQQMRGLDLPPVRSSDDKVRAMIARMQDVLTANASSSAELRANAAAQLLAATAELDESDRPVRVTALAEAWLDLQEMMGETVLEADRKAMVLFPLYIARIFYRLYGDDLATWSRDSPHWRSFLSLQEIWNELAGSGKTVRLRGDEEQDFTLRLRAEKGLVQREEEEEIVEDEEEGEVVRAKKKRTLPVAIKKDMIVVSRDRDVARVHMDVGSWKKDILEGGEVWESAPKLETIERITWSFLVMAVEDYLHMSVPDAPLLKTFDTLLAGFGVPEITDGNRAYLTYIGQRVREISDDITKASEGVYMANLGNLLDAYLATIRAWKKVEGRGERGRLQQGFKAAYSAISDLLYGFLSDRSNGWGRLFGRGGTAQDTKLSDIFSEFLFALWRPQEAATMAAIVDPSTMYDHIIDYIIGLLGGGKAATRDEKGILYKTLGDVLRMPSICTFARALEIVSTTNIYGNDVYTSRLVAGHGKQRPSAERANRLIRDTLRDQWAVEPVTFEIADLKDNEEVRVYLKELDFQYGGRKLYDAKQRQADNDRRTRKTVPTHEVHMAIVFKGSVPYYKSQLLGVLDPGYYDPRYYPMLPGPHDRGELARTERFYVWYTGMRENGERFYELSHPPPQGFVSMIAKFTPLDGNSTARKAFAPVVYEEALLERLEKTEADVLVADDFVAPDDEVDDEEEYEEIKPAEITELGKVQERAVRKRAARKMPGMVEIPEELVQPIPESVGALIGTPIKGKERGVFSASASEVLWRIVQLSKMANDTVVRVHPEWLSTAAASAVDVRSRMEGDAPVSLKISELVHEDTVHNREYAIHRLGEDTSVHDPLVFRLRGRDAFYDPATYGLKAPVAVERVVVSQMFVYRLFGTPVAWQKRLIDEVTALWMRVTRTGMLDAWGAPSVEGAELSLDEAVARASALDALLAVDYMRMLVADGAERRAGKPETFPGFFARNRLRLRYWPDAEKTPKTMFARSRDIVAAAGFDPTPPRAADKPTFLEMSGQLLRAETACSDLLGRAARDLAMRIRIVSEIAAEAPAPIGLGVDSFFLADDLVHRLKTAMSVDDLRVSAYFFAMWVAQGYVHSDVVCRVGETYGVRRIPIDSSLSAMRMGPVNTVTQRRTAAFSRSHNIYAFLLIMTYAFGDVLLRRREDDHFLLTEVLPAPAVQWARGLLRGAIRARHKTQDRKVAGAF